MFIYVLCEALYCHAGKFQVRYFARNDLLSYVHESRKDEQNLLPFKTDYVGQLTCERDKNVTSSHVRDQVLHGL